MKRSTQILATCAVIVVAACVGISAALGSSDPVTVTQQQAMDANAVIQQYIQQHPDSPVPAPSTPAPSTPAPSTPAPSTPAPTPTSQTWPGPSNTGVPAGVTLSAYTGPMTITTAGTVINAKTITGDLVISALNVVIKNSKLNGHVDSDSVNASVTVTNSEVDNGTASSPAIGYSNVTVIKSNVHGGQHSVLCSDTCLIQNSWLHGQGLPANQAFHNNAFISNGGSGITLTGNTLQCTPQDNAVEGGCTADVSLFGDFATIQHVKISGNLFKATPGGYCGTFGYNPSKAFGSTPSDVSVTGNVFEHGTGGKCGFWGPVTSFLAGSGNVWSANTWDDGTTVPAA